MLKGDVSGSLAEFDRAIELDPRQKACRSSVIDYGSFALPLRFCFD